MSAYKRADDVYILERLGEEDDRLRVRSKRSKRNYLLETAVLKPLLSGQNIGRYSPLSSRYVLLSPYHVESRKAKLIPPEDFASEYPAAWEYLNEHKDRLENRENGKMRHERWYDYVYRKNLGLHEEPKLCVPRLLTRLKAAYDESGAFYLDNVDVNGILGVSDPLFLLALLNSTLLDFYFQRITVPFHSGFRSANRQFIDPLPIRTRDTETVESREIHARVVLLAGRMLELHRGMAGKGIVRDYDREQIDREIASTDSEIDRLVFDLYGLTAAERKLVDGDRI